MEKKIKNDILKVLERAKELIKKKRFSELKELSDHTIHNSAVYQDSDSINTAVLIYSLYKLFNKPHFSEQDYENVLKELNNAINALKEDNYSQYNHAYKNIYHLLSLVREIKDNIKYVIQQAQIKKGSRVVYHGLSIAQAANIFGISQWDLMNYLGKTNIYDSFTPEIPVKKRLDFAKEIFNENNEK